MEEEDEEEYEGMRGMDEVEEEDVEGEMDGEEVNEALVVEWMTLAGAVGVLPGVDFQCSLQSNKSCPANARRTRRNRRRRK